MRARCSIPSDLHAAESALAQWQDGEANRTLVESIYSRVPSVQVRGVSGKLITRIEFDEFAKLFFQQYYQRLVKQLGG